jgi:segregation and condensation protein B
MNIKSILESLLFINENPIEARDLATVLGVDKKEIEDNLEELSLEYRERNAGICIIKVAGGYQMCSNPSNEDWVRKMYQEKKRYRLSHASLETLAIVAYKQPVTRPEIESIRGVNVDGVIQHLLELGLLKTAGRKEVVGRPFLYVTTRKFLEYFGLNSLQDLPKLEEFSEFSKSLE